MSLPDGATIPATVLATVSRRGREVVVVDGGCRITGAEFEHLVIDATRAMVAAGVGRGDRVAVWAPNSLEWILAALGAQCAGAALVPINTRWKGAEAAHVVRAANVKVLCAQPGFLDVDTVALLADDLATSGDAPTGLQRVVLLPGGATVAERVGGASIESWAQFVAAGAAVSADAARERAAAVAPSDTSDILFTSGTTGRPKGVVMTHAQTVRQFLGWCDYADVREGDQYLIVNPFFHMFGYKAGWLAGLMRGATIHPVPVLDVPSVLETVQRERITVLPGPPTLYRTILDHPGRGGYDLSSLRVAVTGAADIPVALIEEMGVELPFTTIRTGYGLTEAGTATGTRADDDATAIATTSGRAMPGLEVVVADSEGAEVPRGDTGEVLIRGYSVMQGYLDDPEATAAAIDADGWLHTGDLATMDERGGVRIVGRLKDMFIVGGFNVYPAEVENMMLAHPAIGQVAVIGVPDARLGEVGMAWVVPAPGQSPVGDEVVAWCRDRMANYKVPRSVMIVGELPINAAGKVVKSDLRAQVTTQGRSE